MTAVMVMVIMTVMVIFDAVLLLRNGSLLRFHTEERIHTQFPRKPDMLPHCCQCCESAFVLHWHVHTDVITAAKTKLGWMPAIVTNANTRHYHSSVATNTLPLFPCRPFGFLRHHPSCSCGSKAVMTSTRSQAMTRLYIGPSKGSSATVCR